MIVSGVFLCKDRAMAESKLPKVKSADEMDVVTFLKHINARHVPLAGLAVVGPSNVPGDEDEGFLRTWHTAVHRLKPEEQNHTHLPAKGEK